MPTNDHDWLAERFEAHRTHLRAVAYRMLGSPSEADDAVQEAWLRLSRADTSGVENLGGWLTTIVGRVCLDMLRSRKARREELLGEHVPEPAVTGTDRADPEHEALLAEALLTLLDPDVVLRADPAAVQAGASAQVRGAPAVAGTFSGRARAAQPALVNGAAAAAWAPGGQPRIVFTFTITRGKIAAIDLLADPERLRNSTSLSS